MIKAEVEKKGRGPSVANTAAGQAWKPSALTQMLLLCQREADRIEIWQSSSKGPGIVVPPEQWDKRQLLDFTLYRRLASLCHTVSLLDNHEKFKKEWRGLVKRAVGNPAEARKVDEPDIEVEE